MATVRRDLRTGYPIWAGRRAPSVAHERLTRDIKTDVLVIGAGITGAMIADALTTAGVQGRGRRPARPGQGLDRRQHRARAVRDRHAADQAHAQDRQGERHSRLAAVAPRRRRARRPLRRTEAHRRGATQLALSRRQHAGPQRARARARGAAGRRSAEPLPRPQVAARRVSRRAGRCAGQPRQPRDRSAQGDARAAASGGRQGRVAVRTDRYRERRATKQAA